MQLEEWIKNDASLQEEMLAKYRQKRVKQILIGIVVCIVGLVALGIAVGATPAEILRIHFPVGCGIAALYALIYLWDLTRISQKRIIKLYQKAAKSCFRSEQEEQEFVRTMKPETYSKMYYYWKTDSFERMFMISKDYIVFLTYQTAYFIKIADIDKVVTETIYKKTNNHKEAIGVSMTIEMKKRENEKKSKSYNLVFSNGEVLSEAIGLMEMFSPQVVVE